jgi:steroid delta-isomerase-like uncharacterized protein
MSMGPETVARTWFEEVWNQGREEAIDSLLAPDAIIDGLVGSAMHGSAGFRSYHRSLRGAFPDIHIDVERSVTQGDYVVVYCHVTGTHMGASLGVPPSGRRVDFRGFAMAKVEDGRVCQGWNCFDFLTMYGQLGLVPPSGVR